VPRFFVVGAGMRAVDSQRLNFGRNELAVRRDNPHPSFTVHQRHRYWTWTLTMFIFIVAVVVVVVEEERGGRGGDDDKRGIQ